MVGRRKKTTTNCRVMTSLAEEKNGGEEEKKKKLFWPNEWETRRLGQRTTGWVVATAACYIVTQTYLEIYMY